MTQQITQGWPIGHIEPVPPVPSLLTSARLLGTNGQSIAADRMEVGTGLVVTPDDQGRYLDGQDNERTVSRYTWATGVAWNQANCVLSHPKRRCLPDGFTTVAPEGFGPAVQTDAFFQYVTMECEMLSDVTYPQLLEVARSVADATAAWAVAQALWFGHPSLPDDPTQPTLRRNAQDVSGGVGLAFALAVARLLSEYAEATGGKGGAVLHVPDVLIPPLQSTWLLRQQGDVYLGPLGCVISPGPGYPHGTFADGPLAPGPLKTETPDHGVTPSTYFGTPSSAEWIYCTGPLQYALGDIRMLPEDEIAQRGFLTQNKTDVWAERQAIVRFDPCTVFAALANNPIGDTFS